MNVLTTGRRGKMWNVNSRDACDEIDKESTPSRKEGKGPQQEMLSHEAMMKEAVPALTSSLFSLDQTSVSAGSGSS
jgi:hypothetical protein